MFIQGGGFADLASPTTNGTEVIIESGYNVVVVTFNYRVGIFGFLASSQIQSDGNANAGLLDQRAALQWVQSYISQVCVHQNLMSIYTNCISLVEILNMSLFMVKVPALKVYPFT